MALSANEIAILIKAKDEASAVFGKVQGKAEGLGKVLGSALRKGAIAGGVAVAGLGIAAIKMGMDFEKSMAEVRTLMPKVSDEAFGALQKDVISFSKEMGIATDQVVPALYQAISAGVPRENVMTFMEVASKAAIGGVTDLETAVDGITSVVNAYGRESMSAGRAADVMFTGVRLGKTTFEELSASLFNVVPMAVAANISFEEITAALATLTAQGVPTAQATTQLREAIKALAAPTEMQSKLMAELGLDFSAARLESIGLVGAFQEMMDATGGNMEQMRKLVGSSEALMAVLGLSGKSADAFTAAIAEAEQATGGLDTAFETMEQTVSRKFEKAMVILKTSLMELGLKTLPFLAEKLTLLTDWLENDLPPLMGAAEQLFINLREELRPFFEDFLLGLETVGPVLKDLGEWIWENGPKMEMAIAAIGAAIVLAFGPGSLAVAAIVYLIIKIGEMRAEWAKAEMDWKTWLKRGFETVGFRATIINDVILPLDEVMTQANQTTASLGDLGKMTVAPLEDLEAVLKSLEVPMESITDEATRFRNIAGITAETVSSDLVPSLGPSGGGLGGAAESAADEVEGLTDEMEALQSTLTDLAGQGLALLNTAIETEEGNLLDLAGAIRTATSDHADLTAQIDEATRALKDAQDEMRNWESTALEGTAEFDDAMFDNEMAVKRVQLAIEILLQKQRKLPEDVPGYQKEWDAIDEEIGGLEDKIARLTGAGNIMELRHEIEFAPQERAIDLMMNPVMEGVLNEIMSGWEAAKAEVDVQTGTLETLEGQQHIADNTLVWLLGAQQNHQELFRRMTSDRTALENAFNSLLGVEETYLPTIATNTADIVGAINSLEAAIPSAQGGMYIQRGGLVNVHMGETIAPAGQATAVGGPGGGDLHVHYEGPLLGDRRQMEAHARVIRPAVRRWFK